MKKEQEMLDKMELTFNYSLLCKGGGYMPNYKSILCPSVYHINIDYHIFSKIFELPVKCDGILSKIENKKNDMSDAEKIAKYLIVRRRLIRLEKIINKI